MKSPLGAQTVLGDRHDPVVRCSIENSVGRLRNSPERTFQRLGTQVHALPLEMGNECRKMTLVAHFRGACCSVCSNSHGQRFRVGKAQHASALCKNLLPRETLKRHHFLFPRRAFDPGDPGGIDLFGASSGESSLTSIKF